MPRDYKRKTSRAGRPKARRLPGWMWLLAGLGAGLSVAYGVHLHYTGAFPGDAVAHVRGSPSAGPAPGRGGAGREADAPADRPPRARFEFYSLLPEMEISVPEHEVARRRAVTDEPESRAEPETVSGALRYVLQAGSFRRLQDADRMRASLALNGMEAKIQTVSIDDRETWYRVRLGPFADIDSLREMRARLRASSIESIVLKIRV